MLVALALVLGFGALLLGLLLLLVGAAVVVWRPASRNVDISWIRTCASGTSAFTRVDLPMPDWPTITVRWPRRYTRSGSGSVRAANSIIG